MRKPIFESVGVEIEDCLPLNELCPILVCVLSHLTACVLTNVVGDQNVLVLLIVYESLTPTQHMVELCRNVLVGRLQSFLISEPFLCIAGNVFLQEVI